MFFKLLHFLTINVCSDVTKNLAHEILLPSLHFVQWVNLKHKGNISNTLQQYSNTDTIKNELLHILPSFKSGLNLENYGGVFSTWRLGSYKLYIDRVACGFSPEDMTQEEHTGANCQDIPMGMSQETFFFVAQGFCYKS